MEGSQPQQQMNVTNVLSPCQQIVEDVKRSTTRWPRSSTNVHGITGSRPANLIQEHVSPVTELQKNLSNLYIEKISMQSQVQQLQVAAKVHMSQDSFQASKTSMRRTTYEACKILSSESANSKVQTEKVSTGSGFGQHYHHQQQSLEQLYKQQQILLQKELMQLLQQYMQHVQQGRLLGQVQTGNASTVNKSQQGPQWLQHMLQQNKMERQLNQMEMKLFDQVVELQQCKVYTENASTANESQQQSLKYQHQQELLLNEQMRLNDQMQLFWQLMQQVRQHMWHVQGRLLGQVQTEEASTVNESQQGPQRLQQLKLELQLQQLEQQLHQLELQQSQVKTENASMANEFRQHYQQQCMQQSQVQRICQPKVKSNPVQPIYPRTKFIMQQPQDSSNLTKGKLVATTAINSMVDASQQPVTLINNQHCNQSYISTTANWIQIPSGKVESSKCLKSKREAFTSPY